MPAIQRSAQPTIPIELLKDACDAAREGSIHVRVGAHGVAATSTHGTLRWELDPLSHERAVDPIGAVLLAHQPPAIDLPDAACQALGVNRAWLEGLCDGLALEPRDSRWSFSSARDLYAHGYESGVLLGISVRSYGNRP